VARLEGRGDAPLAWASAGYPAGGIGPWQWNQCMAEPTSVTYSLVRLRKFEVRERRYSGYGIDRS
jgi:hypothetical protein